MRSDIEVEGLQPKTDGLLKSLDEPQHILDDGALLHRLPWEKCSTYCRYLHQIPRLCEA